MTAIIAFWVPNRATIQTHFSKYNFYQALPKVVVTFYLRLRNEILPFPRQKPGLSLADPAGQLIRGLSFGGKGLKFISQSQIKGDHNFI